MSAEPLSAQRQVLAKASERQNGLGQRARVKYHWASVCNGNEGPYSQTPVGCCILDFEQPGKIIMKKKVIRQEQRGEKYIEEMMTGTGRSTDNLAGLKASSGA